MKTPRQSIKLEEEQRQLLEEWVRAHRTPQQVVKRCQIILRSAEGKSDEAIAKELDINRHTCRLWRERFASCGADCLWVEAGRGRKSQAGLAQRIIEATLHSKPTGQTHWTTRKMAKEAGSPRQHCGANLAGARTQTSPAKELQTVTGPEVRRKASRCGRDLSQSSPARRRALCQ